MSEFINNKEHRQKALKDLIMELHEGKKIEEVKAKFEKMFGGVSTAEIAEMEQNLMKEGMPVEEVQRLCDVHAAVFRGSIEDIHSPKETNSSKEIPGHPVHTFKLENEEINKLLNDRLRNDLDNYKQSDTKEHIDKIIEDLNMLWNIDKHYSRKENLLFPFLEKYGITGPTKVMWGVDDEIRDLLKTAIKNLEDHKGNKDNTIQEIEKVVHDIEEMIFKEENILLPMANDNLTEEDWIKILQESDEIGYCLIEPRLEWNPDNTILDNENQQGDINLLKGSVKFETGVLTPKEINMMLNHLPVDITYIDKDDEVKYFSQAKERIFTRTKTIIGRTVQNCHPPSSVHVVEELLKDFKSGKKDSEDFWISMGDMYVLIRYFALRDEDGNYMGTIEVTQNIKPIQELTGEKRLMTE